MKLYSLFFVLLISTSGVHAKTCVSDIMAYAIFNEQYVMIHDETVALSSNGVELCTIHGNLMVLTSDLLTLSYHEIKLSTHLNDVCSTDLDVHAWEVAVQKLTSLTKIINMRCNDAQSTK